MNTHGTATGKIILMGEHAVVYGQPAIALPFLHATVDTSITKIDTASTIESQYYSGPLKLAPPILAGINNLIDIALKYLKKESQQLHIKIDSTLPAQRGLGSSAAVSISLVRALFNVFDTKLEDDVLKMLVSHAEKIHHINPSGLDMNTIASGKAIYFEQGKALHAFDININAYLVIADTGILGQTREAVKQVREHYNLNEEKMVQLMESYGELTKNVMNVLRKGDTQALGQAMNQAQDILRSFGVSNNAIEDYIDLALKNGALGAKITGSGMGGCTLALCETEAVAKHVEEEIKAHGAENVWIFDLKELA